MRSFTYDALPGRVVFGVGAAGRLAEEVDRLGASRLLLVGSKRAVEGPAEQLGGRVAGSFTDTRQHVPDETAQAARELARELAADGLVAVGGGSATGLAKVVALEHPAPIVAVPTNYAGSEMTPIWGLTSGEHKRTGRDRRALPAVVVYDPALTVSLPAALTGPSGMNALAHCVEGLYAPGANPATSALALEGARALARGLPAAVAEPGDLEGRSDALLGAWLGGTVLAAAGSAIHHQVCHVLGGAFGLDHAGTHTAVLPHAVRFVSGAVPDEMAAVAGALGAADAASGCYDLARRLGAPASLRELGLDRADLDRAAELAAARVAQAPRPAGPAELRALLADAWAGIRPTAAGS
jgi:maleylacetate reductase